MYEPYKLNSFPLKLLKNTTVSVPNIVLFKTATLTVTNFDPLYTYCTFVAILNMGVKPGSINVNCTIQKECLRAIYGADTINFYMYRFLDILVYLSPDKKFVHLDIGIVCF